MDMNLKVEKARGWDVKKSTDDIWEVFADPTVVVLKQKTCTCWKWQFRGLPCVYAASIILLKLNGRYDLIDKYFHTSWYMEAYASAIILFSKPEHNGDGNVVRALEYHQTRGRPKRRRITSQGEVITRKIMCGQCGELSNHNKKTCRKRPVQS